MADDENRIDEEEVEGHGTGRHPLANDEPRSEGQGTDEVEAHGTGRHPL